MPTLVRYTSSSAAGAIATLSLFLIMDALSKPPNTLNLDTETPTPIIPYIEEPPSEIVPQPRSVPKPSPPPIPPKGEQKRIEGDRHIIPHTPSSQPTGPELPNLNTLSLAQEDGEAVILVAVQPHYPRRCSDKSIEGIVDVMFDIDTAGLVINPTVLSEPESCGFGRAALNALAKFRFKPKLISGKAQMVSGLQYRFRFSLSD